MYDIPKLSSEHLLDGYAFWAKSQLAKIPEFCAKRPNDFAGCRGS